MPKIPFTQAFPEVLDDIILEYLPFSDLNRMIESLSADDISRKACEKNLRKTHPNYINFIEAKAADNYGLLLHNLKEKVLPNLHLHFTEDESLSDKNKYLALCSASAGHLAGIIKSDFYTIHVQEKLDAQFVRDCIFHYAQHSPQEAGRILNKNIWKFWDRYVTECLIEYGANVNVRHEDKAYSTLFQAMRWYGSAIIVKKLFDKGADYSAFKETRAEINFTMMLVAALSSDAEVLEVFVREVPDEVDSTLDSLNEMLLTFAEEKFSCIYNDIVETDGNAQKKLFYTYSDILIAKAKLRKCRRQLLFDQYVDDSQPDSPHRCSSSFFSNIEFSSRMEDSPNATANHKL